MPWIDLEISSCLLVTFVRSLHSLLNRSSSSSLLHSFAITLSLSLFLYPCGPRGLIICLSLITQLQRSELRPRPVLLRPIVRATIIATHD